MAELDGEFWIHDGTSTYADGDIGDVNHESVVINHIRGVVADKCGVSFDYDGDSMDDLLRRIGEPAYEEQRAAAEKRGDLSEVEALDVRWQDDEDYAHFAYPVMEAAGVTQDERMIAEDSPYPCARTYAMEHLGWRRVKDSAVETWTFTKDDANDILDGLWDAHSELEDDDEVTIYVLSTERAYTMTITELQEMAEGTTVPESSDADIEAAAVAKNVEARNDEVRHPHYSSYGD